MTPGTINYVLKVLKYPGHQSKAAYTLVFTSRCKGVLENCIYVDRKERQVPKPAKLHAIVLCQTPWKPGAPRVIMLKQPCAPVQHPTSITHNLVFLRLFKSLPVTFTPY